MRGLEYMIEDAAADGVVHRILVAGVAFALLAGCSSKPEPAASAPPADSRSSPPPISPPPVDACIPIAARFRAALDAAPGTCATAADCGCYNPVAAGLGCGGVTDAATAAALARIEADFHVAKCAWPLQCAAWACQPRCDAGRCTR